MPSDSFDSVVLDVRGMWCTSCANALEGVLRRHAGVLEAKVNLASQSALVQWDPAATSLRDLLAGTARLGYECVPDGESHDRGAHFAKIKGDLSLRLVVALFFSMWVMVAQWSLYLTPADSISASAQYWLAVFSGLTAAPVTGYSAAPFFRAAWRTVLARAPGMDFLVTLGASTSYLLSLWALFEGRSIVYFDSAVMIVTFLLIGRLLETVVRSRSSDAVRSLLDLPPEPAEVVEADGSESIVLAKRVPLGSVIRIRPGERVPLDGIIVSGASSLDRSILTGETALKALKPGEMVEAGGLNGDGELLVRVTAIWGQRRVDRIAQNVRQMLARKTAAQALAERATHYLVPAICTIAAAMLVWGAAEGMGFAAALERAVAVLVITCPCALGMAVPLALTAGVGRAARGGILFRDVEAIEKAGRVTMFFLDKTGTLTEGRPQLVDVAPAAGVSRDELIEDATIAERGSEHPLAKAIRSLRAEMRGAGLVAPAATSRAVPGRGVEWDDGNGTSILVGSRDFLLASGIRLPTVETHDTAVHVARNGQWRGCLMFSDTPRSGAKQAIEALRRSGAGIAMLTGDETDVALGVAEAVGIASDEVYAEQQPEAKSARIAAAQAAGCTVAFVGDGLNDAPALAAADLGVTVGGASASSVAAASIVLVDGGIERLDAAVAVARATARAMRQNLGAAVIYNLLAVPLAAGGFVAPAMAAGLMIASSLSVTLNAARLALGHRMLRERDRRKTSPASQGGRHARDLLDHRTLQPTSPATTG
jgi:heavy metal translocating P-type ATPase